MQSSLAAGRRHDQRLSIRLRSSGRRESADASSRAVNRRLPHRRISESLVAITRRQIARTRRPLDRKMLERRCPELTTPRRFRKTEIWLPKRNALRNSKGLELPRFCGAAIVWRETRERRLLQTFPACRRPRFEPRPRWPRRSPCAAPHALVRGQPGAVLELEVERFGGRPNLPIVSLRRVA